MQLLLAKGANPNLTTRNYTTALMFAAGGGRRPRRATGDAQVLEAIALCPRARRRHPCLQRRRRTALHIAVERRSDAVVKFLAEHGADLDSQDKSGRTPLDIAMGASPAGFTGRRGAGPGRVREARRRC